MERDSFLFYRSFYDAVSGLPKDIRLEVYEAIMKYALLGVCDDELKPVARGMFMLIKPNIDANTARYVNGNKGGRKRSADAKKKTDKQPYALSFEQEVDSLKADAQWSASFCSEYKLSPEQYADCLDSFVKHCRSDHRKNRPHNSLEDAKSHLRYCMDKDIFKLTSAPADTPTSDYDYDGGFGGMDN